MSNFPRVWEPIVYMRGKQVFGDGTDIPSYGQNQGYFQKLRSQSLGLFSIILLSIFQGLGGMSDD